MQQANIINMNHNRSTALQRSVKVTGGLNRFYGIPTSPSASVMAQNIQLFGPRELINNKAEISKLDKNDSGSKRRYDKERRPWPS